MDLPSFFGKAKSLGAANKLFLKKLKGKQFRNLDNVFQDAHEEVFEKIDCLTCANCCKTTSPIFYQKDIERLAKRLRMKPFDFTEKYLRIDSDNDYVLKQAPCPFLGDDNYCGVYEDRPTACREYPHTNRKNMYQVLDLVYKNTFVCPAVLKIVDEVKKHIG
ncbi:MAG: YkgJ family cysteine cluster protein [Bacteroidia bacterium]